MTNMAQDIQGLYRHYKGKNYRVLRKAKHSKTLEEFVVYQALTGDGETWIRPATLFFENVQVNGSAIPRFVKIEEERQ
jgi:hypothetical protein